MLINSDYLLWGFGILGLVAAALFAIFVQRLFRDRITANMSKLLSCLAMIVGVGVWGSQWAIGTTIFIVDNNDNCPKMRLIGKLYYKLANGDSILLSAASQDVKNDDADRKTLVLNNLNVPLGLNRLYYFNERNSQNAQVPEGSSEMLTTLIAPYSLTRTESIDFALTTPPETVKMNSDENVTVKHWLHLEPEMVLSEFKASDNSFSLNLPAAYSHETNGEMIDIFFATDSLTSIRIFRHHRKPGTETENITKYVESYAKWIAENNLALYRRQNDQVSDSISKLDGHPAQSYFLASRTDSDHNYLTFVETDKTVYLIHIESYRYRMSDMINMILRSFKAEN